MKIIPFIRSLVLALMVFAAAVAASAQVRVVVSFGPPALPVYEQPIAPGEGYIWVPGYWSYADGQYYWVPGTWVLAPRPGYLWTPGYWAWAGDGFLFHRGYWGPRVGFYGGINYGFGYFGHGYEGGRWEDGKFYYNRAVNNVNITNVRYVYNDRTIVNNEPAGRVSYNGGKGGTTARPTPEEEAAAHETHLPPVAAQRQQRYAARANPQQRASVNHGKPPVAATPKPGAFHGRGVMVAREAGAPYHPSSNHGRARPVTNEKGRQPDENRPPAERHQPTAHHQPTPPAQHYPATEHRPPTEQHHSAAQGHPPKQGKPPAQDHPQDQGHNPGHGHPPEQGKPPRGRL